MSEPSGNLDQALEAVASWQAEKQAAIDDELGKLDTALEDLRQAIQNLTEQQEALGQRRAELDARKGGLEEEAAGRCHEALFAGLLVQRDQVTTRAEAMAQAEAAHAAALEAALGDPEVTQLRADHEAFLRDVAPTLDALPESYRNVLKAHHDQIEAKLNEAIANVDRTPPTLEAQALGCDVLLSVDPAEGAAEVVTLVMPVAPEVHENWKDQDEGLQTRLALRTVQVLYEVCRGHGLNAVEAMFGGHKGLLAVELDVGSASVEGLAEALQVELDKIYETAPELLRARLGARARVISPDYLYPPDDAEDIDEAELEELPDA